MRQYRKLTKYEQREIANKLSFYLLPFFGNVIYYREEDLQADFTKFQKSELYENVVSKFQNENQVDVSFLLKPKRWKVCTVCFKPFIATDTGNKQTLCRYTTYKKYTTNGKQLNVHNRSACEMESRRRASKHWYDLKEACQV